MAEFDQEPILPDTEMSGSAPVASVINPALVPAVNILSNVGSQGVPAPSSAMDARQRATDVSRFLARQMETLAKPDRYGDLINAALMSAANPGRVTVPGALQQAEGQRLNRAYNIANAMAGLGRQVAPGQLTQRDLVNLAFREAEAGERRGERNATLLLNWSRPYGTQYGPEGATIAMEAAIEAQRENPNAAPEATLARASKIAEDRIRERGIQPARGETTGARSQEVTKDENGFWVGGGRLTREQVVSNALRRQGKNSEADEVDARMVAAAKGEKPGGAERDLSTFRNQYAAALTTVDLIDQMRSQMSQGGSSIMGAAGSLSRIAEGLGAQAKAIIGIDDIRGKLADANATFQRDVLHTPQTREAFKWLDTANAEQAAAFKSNIIILGTSLAKALDPSGRLSNQDVQQALAIIGQEGSGILTSPAKMNAAMNAVERYVQSTLERRRQVFPGISAAYPESITLRQGGAAQGPAPAQPAAAPQTVPQVPAFDPAKINSLLEKYAPR
jgi:hypothetical protein